MSTTIPYRAGEPLGRRFLGLVLRAQWEQSDRRTDARIAKQMKRGEKFPRELNGDPIRPLGPYPLSEALDTIWFDTVALSMKTVRTFSARMGHVSQEAERFDRDGDHGDEAALQAILEKGTALRRGLLRAALRGFDGLFDGREPTDEDLEALEDAGYAEHLESAVLFLHDLAGPEKKTCGVSQPPTSLTTTATPAMPASATPAAASAPSAPPRPPTTPAPSTSIGSAPSGSP